MASFADHPCELLHKSSRSSHPERDPHIGLNQMLTPRQLAGVATGTAAFAATLAAAPIPSAHAQAIDTIAQTATGHVSTAFSYILNTACFIGGGLLLAMALFGWWQHQRNPNAGSKPTVVLAGFVVAGLLLALPFVAKTATFTLFGQGPSVTGAQQQMQFNQ